MRRFLLIGGPVVVVAAALVVGVTLLSPSLPDWWPWGAEDTDSAADTAAVATSFQAAEIRDMEAVTTLSGTLGFPEGDPIGSRLNGTITAVAAAGTIVPEGGVLFEVDGSPVTFLVGDIPAFRDLGPAQVTVAAGTTGTVTAVADPGQILAFNEEMFRINNEPVVALQGDLPAWRTMRRNTVGPDVLQLETDLVAMGYDPDGTITVDDTFSASTQAIVEDWQTDVGMVVDGTVDLGEIVFLPAVPTVRAVSTALGATVNGSSPVVQVLSGSNGVEGADVTQLQAALARLGYGVSVTGVFDSATEEAVRSWQASVGTEVDGVLDLGEVIFLPVPVRITDAALGIGEAVRDGSVVLATSGNTSIVSLGLPADQQDLISVGDEVTVVLPNDSEVPGTVTSISGIATRGAGGDTTFATTIDIGVLDSALDQAPVDVDVVTDSRPQVLAVPVTALLALVEGGYAVEVGDATATHLVPVTPGLYADGWVQVESDGLHAGDMVVVP